MQTICAHCYRSLRRRTQGFGQILCTNCERRWHDGQRPLSSGLQLGRPDCPIQRVEKRLGLS